MVGGFLVLSTAYVWQDGISSSNGYIGAARVSGCACHGENNELSDATQVMITTEATSFEPGQQYRFTVTANNPSQVSAGVNVAKRHTGSSLDTIPGQGLKRQRISQSQPFELTHRRPKAISDGSVSWDFFYTAPTEAATDTIYAVVNAVDGNGNANAGDQWNFAPKFAVVIQSNSVSPRNDIAEAFAIGPNPARDLAKLYFTMKKPADLRVSLLDASGREMYVQHKQDLSFGRGEIMLDMSGLTAGDYLVNVSSGGELLYTGKLAHTK